MKYEDIPKLTSYGNYTVDSELKYFLEWIDEKIEKMNLQICPDFQRGHVWTENQQTSFIEFLLRGGQPAPLLFNHPNWMGSFTGEFVLVDGLQRLTAIQKFMNNNLPVFNGNFLSDFDQINRIQRISIKYSVNNLKTRKEVLKWYLELNSTGTPHTKEEIERVEELLKNE